MATFLNTPRVTAFFLSLDHLKTSVTANQDTMDSIAQRIHVDYELA
ncbi:hypothetical protein [Nostoc sp. TCL26-01]|nr:hypothetical protein [Nostoc sp. TCL26-01]